MALKLKIIDSENVDYDFDSQNPVIIDGLEQFKQSLYNEFQQNKGQWWHNILLGMPRINQPNKDGLFERRIFQTTAFETEIKRILDRNNDVIQKYEFLSSTISKTRMYSCVIRLHTIYGQTEVVF